MAKKNKDYFNVDREFFELGLRPHTAMVYLCLLSSINKDTRQCWPSMKTIARKLNISKSTVEKAIVELERKQLIIKSNRSRDSRISATSTPCLMVFHITTERARMSFCIWYPVTLTRVVLPEQAVRK